MARYSDEIKQKARKTYIYERLSLSSVSVVIDVPYQTVARWKKQAADEGDDWDKVRSAHTMAGGDIEDLGRQILSDFVVQFKSTMDKVRDSEDLDVKTRVELLTSLTDSYNKAIAANRKMLPETSKLAVAIEVLTKLSEYVREHKPELLTDFMDVLEPFGEQIARELK